jgi:3',5'-cyclic AMP phosphodiesterase CpdA
MADCQLGCYATFSGMTEEDVEVFAQRDMAVQAVPRVEGWAWDAARFETAIAAANRLRPAFVVVGGDMINDPAVEGQYRDLTSIAGQLDDIPIHWVPGNHDVATDMVAPTAESLSWYRERFGPDYGAFEHDGTVLISLNSVVLDHPEHVGDELNAQMAFLESTLRDAQRQRSRHVIVFGHHPLFTAHPAEEDTYWNIPSTRRGEILDMLNAFGASSYFCGHWHRNGGGRDRNLEVVVTGPVGYPLGVDPSGFRIVDVSDDGIAHRYVALDAVAAASAAGQASL